MAGQRRVVLFGGAFDPPHVGHVMCVSNVLNAGVAEELWFVPSGDGRYDKTPVVSAIHRLAMLELMVSEHFGERHNVKIIRDDVEGRVHDSATIHLVDYLTELHPKKSFQFLIGVDNISQIPEWKEFNRLKEAVQFVAVPRDGSQLPEKIPPYVTVLEPEKCFRSSVSSSQVRRALAEDRILSGVLDRRVRKYIQTHALYL